MGAELIDLENTPWEPFGGRTKDIFRKSFSSRVFPSGFRASLTLARPGGEFPEHVDSYAHIFYILKGEGEAILDGRKFPLKPGHALTVAAGRKHGYRNESGSDLILITLNIHERVEEK